MLQTPRSRFLEQSALVKVHQDIVVSTPFQTAADAALLQLIWELPDSTEPATAIAGYHQIVGAQRFLKLLQGIGEPAKPLSPKLTNDNLSHER